MKNRFDLMVWLETKKINLYPFNIVFQNKVYIKYINNNLDL